MATSPMDAKMAGKTFLVLFMIELFWCVAGCEPRSQTSEDSVSFTDAMEISGFHEITGESSPIGNP